MGTDLYSSKSTGISEDIYNLTLNTMPINTPKYDAHAGTYNVAPNVDSSTQKGEIENRD